MSLSDLFGKKLNSTMNNMAVIECGESLTKAVKACKRRNTCIEAAYDPTGSYITLTLNGKPNGDLDQLAFTAGAGKAVELLEKAGVAIKTNAYKTVRNIGCDYDLSDIEQGLSPHVYEQSLSRWNKRK